MKYFTPERVRYLKKSFENFKHRKTVTILVIILSLGTSLFDGFSLGAILPFLQNFTQANSEETFVFPFLEGLQRILSSGTQEDVILKLLIFALSMIILRSIFNYWRVITIQRASTLIRRDLQNTLFSAIADSDYRYYEKMKTGNVIGSISEFSVGTTAFHFVLLEFIVKFLKLAVYAVLLLSISWKFTLIAIAFELAILPAIKIILTRVKNISKKITDTINSLHIRMVEMFANIRLMKIFSTEDYEKKKFQTMTKSLAQLDYEHTKNQSIISPITEVSVLAAIIILFVVSIKIININILLLLPFIVAYLYVFMRAFNEMTATIKLFSRLFTHIEHYRAFDRLLTEAQQYTTKTGGIILKKFNHEISLNNVSFSYEPEKPILNNVTFTVNKGTFVAIVGSSGSGKSTMANIIAGLLKPHKGGVYIDDTDLRTINVESWHGHIGYIAQDIAIFDETIRYNIAYGSPQAPFEDIKKAARIADIDTFIESLPQGYETIVGERGTKLSGGQRQRIAIARAVVRNPEILILDEATSALDTETEREVQHALDNAMKNKTVIAIAHRLSTIVGADTIIVLENGTIVEQGTHEELMKQKGPYKRYYEMQFKE